MGHVTFGAQAGICNKNADCHLKSWLLKIKKRQDPHHYDNPGYYILCMIVYMYFNPMHTQKRLSLKKSLFLSLGTFLFLMRSPQSFKNNNVYTQDESSQIVNCYKNQVKQVVSGCFLDLFFFWVAIVTTFLRQIFVASLHEGPSPKTLHGKVTQSREADRWNIR